MKYYCLIAGLPEIEIDDNKLSINISDFREDLRSQLSDKDNQLIDLLYTQYDNQNLLRYLNDKDAELDTRGNLTKEELEEGIRLISEDEDPKNKHFPPYFKTFIEEFKETQTAVESTRWENRISELYYQWAMQNKNKFVSKWFEFNLNLNNILTAYTYRKYQMETEVVGDNEVAQSIRGSNQRDLGLTGTIDNLEELQRIADESDLFEREKKIDLLKWSWLDEETFFEYFTIERIFAYVIKLGIIERWANLDHEEGKKIFRELINRLKESVVKEQEL
ncbi:MAG: DUF2764 domain-containing protein [Bacteroidales bacterium]|jgi:hypothetical protein|nr:DUF2764 domain-containing protein [Bacteroidales bacterium]